VGFIAPSLVLERQIAGRKRVAEEGFPDTLDMLLVCIEAGQGFEQAARRIAKELKGHNEVLAEELTILNDELWAGKDRGTVFRDFSQRLDVNDITAFISVLRQADQFGVSIAEAIRVYASDMRFKRVMRAEEKANTMPLKLALASMAFTVPPTMIIMIGPSLLEIARSFAHT
jgi:tight adherence protein C